MKDHRELGRELELFMFHEYAPGAVFWLPKGWTVYQTLLEFIRQKTEQDGYLEIATPVMVKSNLFKKSGHWEHFGEHNMFNLEIENEKYSLKPMNCPEATLVFASSTRSYQDLPIKLSDFGVLHRRELSGVLGGLLRVRQFTIDDAHLFVRPDQIQEEICKLLDLTQDVYKSLGFKPSFYLATKPDKSMGDEKTWQMAETDLEKALKSSKVDFDIKPKDGAFYGPKIDIHIKDSQNRDWQLATIQLDFQIPKSMQISYVDRDGSKKQPVMIHRGIFGSLERFIGILLEHTQGNLPLWLSPIQVVVIPITDNQLSFSKEIIQMIKESGVRVKLDDRSETMQAKIRDATIQKIPYLLIIGAKEVEAKKIAVRTHSGQDLGQQSIAQFKEKILGEIENKT